MKTLVELTSLPESGCAPSQKEQASCGQEAPQKLATYPTSCAVTGYLISDKSYAAGGAVA